MPLRLVRHITEPQRLRVAASRQPVYAGDDVEVVVLVEETDPLRADILVDLVGLVRVGGGEKLAEEADETTRCAMMHMLMTASLCFLNRQRISCHCEATETLRLRGGRRRVRSCAGGRGGR